MIEILVNNASDRKNVSEYIDCSLQSKGLDSFVKKTLFGDQQLDKYISFYNYDNKLLFINVDKISSLFYGWLKKYNIKYNDENKYRFLGIFLTCIIERELRHIGQIKESDYTTNPILLEGIDMLKRYPFDITKKESKIYEDYFDYIPLERNASIQGFLQLLDDGNEYHHVLTPYEENIIRNKLYEYCNLGYESGSSPTEKYYRMVGKKKEFKKLDLTNMDSCQRTLWGLPSK